MKNYILLILAMLFSNTLSAQKYSTKTGNLSFTGSIPIFEDISAVDKNNVTVLNPETSAIASISSVSNFKFSVKLMEEHFNENYAESTKYPKTTFKGKIDNFKVADLTSSYKKYIIRGTLNFHGVSKEITTEALIQLKDNKILIKGGFKIIPGDYKVAIPKMVAKKIAKEIDVKYSYILSKQ